MSGFAKERDAYDVFLQSFGALSATHGAGKAFEHLMQYMSGAFEAGCFMRACAACYMIYTKPKKIMMERNEDKDQTNLTQFLPYHAGTPGKQPWQTSESRGADAADPSKMQAQEDSRSKYSFLQGVNISLAYRVAMIVIELSVEGHDGIHKHGFAWKTAYRLTPMTATLASIIKSPMVVKTRGKPGGFVTVDDPARADDPEAYGEHVNIMFQQFSRFQSEAVYARPAMDLMRQYLMA
jgi:hypothetical protein